MLDHNISFWFVAHEFNANTPNDFKKHYNNNIQNYFGDSRRVERLCSGFPAHSE